MIDGPLPANPIPGQLHPLVSTGLEADLSISEIHHIEALCSPFVGRREVVHVSVRADPTCAT